MKKIWIMDSDSLIQSNSVKIIKTEKKVSAKEHGCNNRLPLQDEKYTSWHDDRTYKIMCTTLLNKIILKGLGIKN